MRKRLVMPRGDRYIGLIWVVGTLVLLGILQLGCARRATKEGQVPPTQKPGEEVTKPEEKAEPQGEGVEAQPEELPPLSLQMIHFDFDQYDIRPQDAEILKENAKVLKAHPKSKIRLEGHCDERGTTEYNLALGERRAASARQYLIDLGIDPARLSTLSYGEEHPLDPASNEEAWAENRRVEFVPEE